jgi:hypothetical protein
MINGKAAVKFIPMIGSLCGQHPFHFKQFLIQRRATEDFFRLVSTTAHTPLRHCFMLFIKFDAKYHDGWCRGMQHVY